MLHALSKLALNLVNSYVIEKWLVSYRKTIKKLDPFNSIINNIKHVPKDFHGKNEEVGQDMASLLGP